MNWWKRWSLSLEMWPPRLPMGVEFHAVPEVRRNRVVEDLVWAYGAPVPIPGHPVLRLSRQVPQNIPLLAIGTVRIPVRPRQQLELPVHCRPRTAMASPAEQLSSCRPWGTMG